MERSHRIKIRERPGPEDDSVPIEFTPEPDHQVQAAPPPRPLIVSFRFGRQLVLADPTWSASIDRGLLYMRFRCPHCWEPVTTGVTTMDERTAAITAHGCVVCACGLHLHIEAGRATAVPANLLCARAPLFAVPNARLGSLGW